MNRKDLKNDIWHVLVTTLDHIEGEPYAKSLSMDDAKRVQSLMKTFDRYSTLDSIIGENERPIFSGHSFCCIFCGKLGGMCDDPQCTGDGGLNAHSEGEYDHKTLLCDCEKRNEVRDKIRSLVEQLKSM